MVSENNNFEVCLLCSYVPTCAPQDRASFDSGASYEQTGWRSTWRFCIPNIKVPHRQVFKKEKNSEGGLLCSYVPTCDPQGRASFVLRGIIWINLIEVYKTMLNTKYQSCTPSSFREEEFWSLPSLCLCSNLRPPGQGQFWPQGHHMNQIMLNTKYQSSTPSSFREEEFWRWAS